MVYGRGLILALAFCFAPALGQDKAAVAEMEQFQQGVKRQARIEAIEEQQNRYCTEELKRELSAVLNTPPDPVTGDVTISPYQAWKLEELYKTCSTIKKPSKTTKMLLDVMPNQIKEHVAEERAYTAE